MSADQQAIDWDTALARYEHDPLGFHAWLWPESRFFDKQEEFLLSVRDDDETVVPAANMVGKDYGAGFASLWGFLCHPVARVITTSVKDDHLRVLWGEIGRWIQTAKHPLTRDKGGPLIVNHRDVRKVYRGAECKISYLRGMVSERGEGLAGHHAAYTLCVMDEASGLDDEVHVQAEKWAGRKLIIGNPRPCTNFFRRLVKAGSLPRDNGNGYHRRVIRVRAEDSPNVRLALEQQARGEVPTNDMVTPGVLRWEDGAKGYVYRRQHWSEIEQCIGLDGEFYEGAEVLLYPPVWLDNAHRVATGLPTNRKAEAIGCDPGEGGANSSWVVGDRHGILEVLSMKTPNTTEIPATTLMLMRKWNVQPDKVAMDRGGGGKQHADYLETHHGVKITTVAFGEAPSIDPRQWLTPAEERVQMKHEKYAFVNRRAEMYWRLRAKLDPALNPKGYGIPAMYTNLRSELAPIPMQSGTWSCWDAEGRFRMPPKNKKRPDSEEVTLTELIGHSPDEADACVLMLHALEAADQVVYAGVK